jgi:hypothetical protein
MERTNAFAATKIGYLEAEIAIELLVMELRKMVTSSPISRVKMDPTPTRRREYPEIGLRCSIRN